MKLVQQTWDNQPQFQEIVGKAIDKTEFVEVTSAGADVEFSIEHGMGVIPLGWLVIAQDKAATLYTGNTVWDTGHIYLKSNISTVSLRILIF
jgi:hypothetical protein